MTTTTNLYGWIALDDLFSNLDSRADLLESFEDESAVSLMAHVFSGFAQDDQWSPDDYSKNSSFFIASLYEVLLEKVSQFSSSEDLKALYRGIANEVSKDRELAKSFTNGECKQFLVAVVQKEEFKLNNLDQISGLYLSLKALEKLYDDFDVLAELHKLSSSR